MKFTSKTAKAMGKKGGLKTKRKYGVKHFKKLSELARKKKDLLTAIDEHINK